MVVPKNELFTTHTKAQNPLRIMFETFRNVEKKFQEFNFGTALPRDMYSLYSIGGISRKIIFDESAT